MEGRPILIEQVGRTKITEVFKLIDDSGFVSYLVQRM
jgi:hypothetical protein